MKRWIIVLLCSGATLVQAGEPLGATEQAMQGDYQAQRNLAYSFAAVKDYGQACAWYLLVLRSDSPKLNAGDVGNVKTYCDRLDFDARLAAERKANALQRSIYGR